MRCVLFLLSGLCGTQSEWTLIYGVYLYGGSAGRLGDEQKQDPAIGAEV